MEPDRQSGRGDRLVSVLTPILGLALMAAGLIATLDNLGVWSGGLEQLATYWPIGLMVLGLVQFSQRKSGLSALVGTAWLFLGGIFLARNLGWLSFRTRDLMPLFWVAIGAVIVWRALAGRRTSTAAGDSSAVVNGLAVLGGIERASSSQAFEGGQLTAIMGGFELDLRNARSTRPEVVIDVLAVWGGVTVRVPPDWAVDGQVVPVLGGFDDKTQPVAKPSQRLVLRGMAIMGGIEAKN